MSAWKPGDVALILVGGTEHVALRDSDEAWLIGDSLAYRVLRDSETRLPTVSVIRPLVVIDPEDAEAVGRLVRIMEDRAGGPGALDGSPMLDMTLVLREFANPTPPKPDEPQGLGAVVRDAEGKAWVRADPVERPWCDATSMGDGWADYSNIDAVEVLSEGWSA